MRSESRTRSHHFGREGLWLVLLVVLAGLSCKPIAPKRTDGGTRGPDGGGHACVFDADTFDGGCTFTP